MKCRYCRSELSLTLVDLGSAPPSNAYLTKQSLHAPEKWFPLRVLVCQVCWLVQTEDFAHAHELFDADYAYFSGFSTTWLQHCERYVVDVIERFGLSAANHVVEVAANDGYLLQYVKACNIPCTGIEPTASTAAAARLKGIPIVEDFFGVRLAKELVAQEKQADLIIANNVLAHVPDLHDFVAGFAVLLKPSGVATFEFPYLLRLIAENQFDTIYHEHFSYLSLTVVDYIFSACGLSVFDVEEQPTHGGSLRVYAQLSNTEPYPRNGQVEELLQREARAGIRYIEYYTGFQTRTDRVKDDFLLFLLKAKREGKSVVGYGAAAKGNTLLNYAGIRPDLVSFIVDRNPVKLGKYMPGNRIPIVDESCIQDIHPDYVLILPWNIKREIMSQLSYIREWGGQFVTAIPELAVMS